MTIVERAGRRLRSQSTSRQNVALVDEDDRKVRQTWGLAGRRDFVLEIDQAKLQRRGLMSPESMNYQMGREYQRIKRPILDTLEDHDERAHRLNRIMLTSAKPHEGKSFTLFNLALSLAQELDFQVLVVDADLNRPRLTHNLDLSDQPGLADLLDTPDLTADEVAIPTDRPRLSIIAAGNDREQSTERLSSRRMRAIVDELGADPHRIVLFDSAPLLYAAEAQALASHMGQILFVVKAMATERRAVESALSLLDPVSARVSIILNQKRRGLGEEYAGYYGPYPNSGDES